VNKINFIIYFVLLESSPLIAHVIGRGGIVPIFFYSILGLIIILLLFGMWKNILLRYLVLYTTALFAFLGLLFFLKDKVS